MNRPLAKNESEVLQLFNDGHSLYAIAKIFDCSTSSVHSFLKRRGIQTNRNNAKKGGRNLQELTAQIILLYTAGHSQVDIANKFDVDISSISRLLKDNNVKSRREYYFLDEEYFASNNINQRVILDIVREFGHFDLKRGRLIVRVSKNDIDKIEFLIHELTYGGPILQYSNYYFVIITRKTFVKHLYDILSQI